MISIIITVYNEVDFIVKTLSHLNVLKEQAKFEVVVSDGGSTDNTVEAVRTYAIIINAPKSKANESTSKYAKGDILRI